jgi:5-methyltetrahydropteroyltriglutamate--homocysteine methyltransferase
MHREESPVRAPELPFFHAETVGSLPHPEELIATRARFDRGEIDAAALRQVEDRAVEDAIALQERVGLPVVTDGELRRETYLDFVLKGVTGVKFGWKEDLSKGAYRDASGKEVATPRTQIVVHDRIRHNMAGSNVEAFKFLKAKSSRPTKATICGPAMIHFSAGRKNISADIYPNLDDFWSDFVEAFRVELELLREVGCRYVQFDETSIIKMVDPTIRETMMERGDDPDELARTYLDVLAAIVAKAPKDMRFCLHLCRGNNRGTWQAEGGYDRIAGMMFDRLPVDAYSLEYDSPRAGSFEPLRQLPEDRHVVLGLLSTKVRQAEDADTIVARIREAAGIVPLERLGVSPQCGFWGGINLCTPEETEAKLRRLVEIANRVWN